VIITKLFAPVLPTLLFCGIVMNSAAAQDSSVPQSSAPFAGWNTGHGNSSEITVSGTIQQVITTHTAGSPAGLHILVESSQGVVNASVGPFLPADIQRALSAGQQIQITGIVRTISGQNFLLARLLVLAGRQITIRNEHGFLVAVPSATGSVPHRKQGAPNGGTQ
jgi:hypothetical protein